MKKLTKRKNNINKTDLGKHLKRHNINIVNNIVIII